MHLYTISHEARQRKVRLYLPNTDTAGGGIRKSEAIPFALHFLKKKETNAVRTKQVVSLYVLYYGSC